MINENIRIFRKEFNMTQKQLADLLSIAANTIGMYEQGRREPDIETIQKLADIFNVTTDQLFGRSIRQEQVTKLPDYAPSPELEKIWTLYEKLDSDDQAEIRGEIKGMLRHEKYVSIVTRKQA